MDTQQLKTGQKIRIVVPFLYEIGDYGYYTGKELKTIEDCKQEVMAEIENGLDAGFYMEVES